MKQILWLIFLFLYTYSFGQISDYSRYTDRLPDWLWKDQIRSAFIDAKIKESLAYKIHILDSVWKDTDTSSLGDKLYKEINQELNSRFSLLDLEIGAPVFNSSSGYSLAIQLDPIFVDKDKKILLDAAKLFIKIAIDDDVLNDAYENSITTPTPYPSIYDSTITTDSIRKYNNKYAFLLSCRTKPLNTKQFKTQLNNALTTLTGDPSLLIIASYHGDPWWGYSFYNYYNFTYTRLAKFSPFSGYFYIAFNTDSLKTNQSIPFWASKIAHEILHNLGYWHPSYETPIDRDTNNIPPKQAFIVAYERAILKKAKMVFELGK